MPRYLWLTPFLGWLILGGCASSAADAPQGAQTSTTVSMSKSVYPCPQTGAGTVYHAQINDPVVVTFSRTTVTESCHCEYTDYGSGYGCNPQKQCETEYDLGGQNPNVCDVIDTEPAPLGEVTVTTDRVDCTASVAVIDPSTTTVSVTCSAPGEADIQISVVGSADETSLPVFFSGDGHSCPPTYPEDDAGVADSAVDAADAGED